MQVKGERVHGATLAHFMVDRHLLAMASAIFDNHSFVKRLTAAGMPKKQAPSRVAGMIALAAGGTPTLVRLL